MFPPHFQFITMDYTRYSCIILMTSIVFLFSNLKWYVSTCLHAQSLQSCLTLCDPMDIACQVPQSMRFSRQEYWRGFPCPPPGDLPNTGTEPESPVAPALQADSLPLSHQGSPCVYICTCKHICVHTHMHTSVFAFILIFTKN